MKIHRPDAIAVAVIFGAAACFGHEQKHIEHRTYQPEPNLTKDVLISTLSGSSPMLIESGGLIGSK